MRKWTTLIGFCLANFSNAIGFGIYTCNLPIYASSYQTTSQTMSNTFYIGLVVEIFLCLPAIRLIQWRFDYAVISGAYLTACAYWIQYFSYGNIVITSLVLNAIAQLFLLPTPPYLAELWFELEKRSLVIGIGFYSNLLGLGLGGTLSSLLSFPNNFITVNTIIQIVAIIGSVCFFFAVLLVKNKPKVRIQKKKKVQWRHSKDLWKQKFTSYNVVMVSVFLGVSWTFLSQFQTLQNKLPSGTTALNVSWMLSGFTFGILMSYMVQKWLAKTGDYKFYDRACKIILLVGILGNLALGILVLLNINNLTAYIFLVILIGIGTIGFFGLAFLSLIQSMYPVPSLLIGTLIALFSSIYSVISLAVSQLFPKINTYFSIAALTFLPWVYYVVTFETNFKRYKYYLNEKQSKFELLKIEDMEQKTQD